MSRVDRLPLALLLLLVLGACGRAAPVATPPRQPAAHAPGEPGRTAAVLPAAVTADSSHAADPTAPREAARAVLVQHCGRCHVGSRPTAVYRACRVFDLDEPDFAARMDARQLRDVLRRLRSDLDERGDARAVPAADVDVWRRYAEEELARRGESGP